MEFINQMFNLAIDYHTMLLEGVKNTLLIATIGTVCGIALGMVIAMLRMQSVHYKDSVLVKALKKVANIIAVLYVDIVRGTPMMVQALIFFYGLSSAGFKMDPIFAGYVIVSLNTAAYIAEIIRSGINGLDKGQIEAARALGLTQGQTMRQVILPQALVNSSPALMNELIVNIKDSSVLSVIGVSELLYMAKGAASETYLVLQAYVLAAIMYLVLTKVATLVLSHLISKIGPDSKKQNFTMPTSQTTPEVV